jgi:uncharacterized iron-regulated protein
VNVNPIIIAALTSIGLPIVPNAYEATADAYIVFNYSDERPAVYADDTDTQDATTVQVHYFTRTNPQANKKAIRKALRTAGFTIINTEEFYEQDTRFTHVVVEAWIEGIIND